MGSRLKKKANIAKSLLVMHLSICYITKKPTNGHGLPHLSRVWPHIQRDTRNLKMAIILTALLVLFVSMLPEDVQMEKTCSKDVINPHQRLDCGWLGISKELCENSTFNKGRCCYDDSVPGVPYCFHGETDKTKNCSADSSGRQDCGWYGIKKEQCLNENFKLGLCCWDESVQNSPWCFYGVKRQLMCSTDIIRPVDRADCGWVGISKEECEGKHGGRCCYDDSVNGAPWCYFGVPGF